MKKTYPIHKDYNEVFNSLSQKNKLAIKNFLSVISVNAKSKKRQDNAFRCLIRFLDFVEKDFDKINDDDFIVVAKAISDSRDYGVYAKNLDRNFIKRFLQENFEDFNTRFKHFKVMKLETRNEKDKITHNDLITEKECERLIKATPNMQNKTLFTVLYESGARPEEVLKLLWSDLDLHKKVIYLYSAKTGKKRAVPLNVSIQHLKRLKEEINPKENNLIFPSNSGQKTIMTNSGLNYIIDSTRQKAGISKKINCYTFRHTRLSHLITKLSPKVYEEIAGHSLEMGMNTYAHLSQDAVIKEMQEKVFEIAELSENERDKLQKQIDELKIKVNKQDKTINDLVAVSVLKEAMDVLK